MISFYEFIPFLFRGYYLPINLYYHEGETPGIILL